MFTLFTLVFFVAKILGYISWSWWLVFSPMLIALGLFVIVYGVAGIISLIDSYKMKKHFKKMFDHEND